MRLVRNFMIGAVLLGGLAPATALAQGYDSCNSNGGYIPAHYETRTVEVQEPGRWVEEAKLVTDPGRWEEFQREECVPGHYETRTQTVELPGHYETVSRQVRDHCGVVTVA